MRTKRTKLLSLGLLLLTSCLLIGGAIFTFALFTGSAASGANAFAAGTLKLDVQNDGTGANFPLFVATTDGELKPGRALPGRTLKVLNVGTLPFKLSGLNAALYNDPQTAADDRVLAQGLWVKVFELEASNPTNKLFIWEGRMSDLAVADGVSVAGIQTVYPPSITPTPTVKEISLLIEISMPSDTLTPLADHNGDGFRDDNDYQGLKLRADLGVTGQQLIP
ncbi:MAG: hypothetical protein KGZ93_07055 [Actinobacteria bacterium]|nr:hypothetical protein [Actinomycetota bacterium]